MKDKRLESRGFEDDDDDDEDEEDIDYEEE